MLKMVWNRASMNFCSMPWMARSRIRKFSNTVLLPQSSLTCSRWSWLLTRNTATFYIQECSAHVSLWQFYGFWSIYVFNPFYFCMWYWVSEWMKVAQLCPTLCNPIDYTVHGILQARILELVASPFSRGSSQPRDRTQISHVAGGFFTSWAIILLPEAVQFSQHHFLKTVFSPLSILASFVMD